ncbi:MAG: hypothetical protein AB8G05_23635 [Oligoflexales bacterium]
MHFLIEFKKLVCSPISFQIDDKQFSYENGADLLSFLLLNPFDEESGITGLVDIEGSICSTDYLYDFTRLDSSTQYYQDLWNATQRTQGMLAFLPEITQTERQEVLQDFLRGVLGLAGREQLVFGCSAHHMRSFLKTVENSESDIEEILENFGWRVVEAKQRSDLLAISINPSTGDNPLTALDPSNFSRRDELAVKEVLPLAKEFVEVALEWFADLGYRLHFICKRGFDLSNLSSEEGLACGQTVPTKYQSPGFCNGLDSCKFEELSETKEHFGLLRDIALFIAQVKVTQAFELDPDFRKAVLELNVESKCLPDASVALQGFVDAKGRLNHEIQVRGPVTREIGGSLQMDISLLQENSQLLYIENSQLNIEKTAEGSCYEGNVNRIRSLDFRAGGVLTGLKAGGYGNTCIEDLFNNLNYQSFIARPSE